MSCTVVTHWLVNEIRSTVLSGLGGPIELCYDQEIVWIRTMKGVFAE